MLENSRLKTIHRFFALSNLVAAVIVAMSASALPRSAQAACSGSAPQESIDKAMAYYKANVRVIEFSGRSPEGPGKKIVINDYSKTDAMMYVYNSETGECEDSSVVGFGNGAGGKLEGSCKEGSHLSPAGFHITSSVQGPGSEYPFPKGLAMVPCEGQEDGGKARGIMIHAGTPDGKRGNTWGCASLPNDVASDYIQNKIKGGSLVYNYWGEGKDIANCNEVGKSDVCKVPSGDSGGGAGSAGGGAKSGKPGGVTQ